MVQGVILSLLLGYLPMLVFACVVFWFDRFEKEPMGFLVAGFTWGSLITAAFAFVLNSLIGAAIFWVSQSQAITNFSVASVAAPVIEEVFKGGFVLAIFLLARHEFDSLLDGIVYGAIAGLGFAATENFYYILNMGFFQDGLDGLANIAVIRIILVGWQHPFYTAFTGMGLACARNSKKTSHKICGSNDWSCDSNYSTCST
ncbi:MAG: PrsW family intramembrane metalloprotease [Anaerolineae bacterium]|nr:PrsW family intramembrane metalloprotease [Anaerolineae bacterium]